MKTPWGELKDLDLTDHELGEKIILADKASLIDGLVVENQIDQLIAAAPEVAESRILALDVETSIVKPQRGRQGMAFVWARQRGPGLRRYLKVLERAFLTWLIDFRDGEFTASPISDGKPDKFGGRLLPDLMAELSGTDSPQELNIAPSVLDRDRQKGAYWGFLLNVYRERLAPRVLLPRLLLNYGIQPYFRGLWNLDRIFVVGNDVWVCEVKHKFPMGNHGKLSFGINRGELEIISMATHAGINYLYAILVKPVWQKSDSGYMYLMNDLAMRSRAVMIGLTPDATDIGRYLSAPSRIAGPHTSLNGNHAVSYQSIPASDFFVLGSMGEPHVISSEMLRAMSKEQCLQVTDEFLRLKRS